MRAQATLRHQPPLLNHLSAELTEVSSAPGGLDPSDSTDLAEDSPPSYTLSSLRVCVFFLELSCLPGWGIPSRLDEAEHVDTNPG